MERKREYVTICPINTTPTITLERIRFVKRNLPNVVRVVKYFSHSWGHKEVVKGKLENFNCTPIV